MICRLSSFKVLTVIIDRAIVYGNLAFSFSENWYFGDFLHEIRPLYESPSRYVLSHSIMDSEVARVAIEDLERLEKQTKLTYLIDGWEDLLKRSLYGSVLAEVSQFPIVLSLEDLTGSRATADGIIGAIERAMSSKNLLDGKKIIAMTMDNPTTMVAIRRKFQEKYYWVLVSVLSLFK